MLPPHIMIWAPNVKKHFSAHDSKANFKSNLGNLILTSRRNSIPLVLVTPAEYDIPAALRSLSGVVASWAVLPRFE
eukprot:1102808-Amphidinium_carterae.3